MKPFVPFTLAFGSMIFMVSSGPALAGGETLPEVPEPATWLLLSSGLAGLAAYRWYKS